MKRRKKKFSGGNFKQYKNKSKRIENKSNEDKRDVGKEDNVSLNQIENEKEESNNKYYIFAIASISYSYFWFYCT